jgi:hypothetical protein
VVVQSPPAPIVERRPAMPGPGYVWIEGHWRWEARRGQWAWVRGHWDIRQGYTWVAGHWDQRPNGWVWVEGRWAAPVVAAPPPPPPAPGVVVASPPPSGPEVIVTSDPPPLIVEEMGRAPGPEFAWIPGRWSWNGRWVWVRGVWRRHPHWHEGGGWVAGHWEPRGGGHVWIEGYWR